MLDRKLEEEHTVFRKGKQQIEIVTTYHEDTKKRERKTEEDLDGNQKTNCTNQMNETARDPNM